MVKRSVLSVWGKGGMRRNELFSVSREHLGKAGSSQHGYEVTEQQGDRRTDGAAV